MRGTGLRRKLTVAGGALAAAAVVAGGPAAANAAWTTLAASHPGAPGGSVLACKRATSSPTFGPLWEVRLAALATADGTASGDLTIRRGGAWVNAVSAAARQGQWVVRSTYASRWYADTYGGFAGTGNLLGQGSGGAVGGLVRDLASC